MTGGIAPSEITFEWSVEVEERGFVIGRMPEILLGRDVDALILESREDAEMLAEHVRRIYGRLNCLTEVQLVRIVRRRISVTRSIWAPEA